MLTISPLPTWFNLCRAMARIPPSDTDLAAPWHRDGEVAGWLSRSTWSLALITLWRQRITLKLPVTVWVPDYFCNSALLALRQTDAKLILYPLTATMAPEMAVCRTLAETTPPDLFLLPHYFGKPNSFGPSRDFCRHHGAWLIEDGAHVLRPVDGIGVCGDFVMYSPHKHLPVPDGAVLVIRPDGPSQFGVQGLTAFGVPASWCGQLRNLQRQMGGSVKSTWGHSIVWLVKRVLQKLGTRFRRFSRIPFSEQWSYGSSKLIQAPQSRLARRMLATVLPSLGTIARLRQRHQLLLDALLLNDKGHNADALLAAERSINREWTPYLAGYQAVFDRAQETYEQWRRSGLPVTTWPDLPPEIMLNQEFHATALNFRHARVYLPVHQDLSIREMLKLCHSRKCFNECEPDLCVAWDKASPRQWQNWMAQAGSSNLLQSWAYGEAKSDNSSWCIKRGVFYSRNRPIAFVQVLQRRVFGSILVSRINRGPLFLTPPTDQERWAVFEKLSAFGNLWEGKLLAVAPELNLSGSNVAMMEDLGFRQFLSSTWESAWIDLTLDVTTLRANLDGKWRNMLSFSEKSGLKLDVGNDDQSFFWMVERYEELMQEKNFIGVPVSLLQGLRKHLGPEASLTIMRAICNDEAVAGICLVSHGNAATYLVGWNGLKGRNLKANQYLLWQAVLHLKQSGLQYFDLGGISEDHTPSIAAFKLGMKGKRYGLVGEYLRY